jgi:hypothetical protein
MNDDKIYDFGPQPPVKSDPETLRQFKLDRAAWVKKYGDAPVLISVFSAGEAIERDPVRFRHRNSVELG